MIELNYFLLDQVTPDLIFVLSFFWWNQCSDKQIFLAKNPLEVYSRERTNKKAKSYLQIPLQVVHLIFITMYFICCCHVFFCKRVSDVKYSLSKLLCLFLRRHDDTCQHASHHSSPSHHAILHVANQHLYRRRRCWICPRSIFGAGVSAVDVDEDEVEIVCEVQPAAIVRYADGGVAEGSILLA